MPAKISEPGCARCNDLGFVKDAAGNLLVCACQHDRRQQAYARYMARELATAEFPRRYQQRLLAEFPYHQPGKRGAWELCMRYATEQPASSLWLHGANGTGKTTLAVGAARVWLEAGKIVLFITVSDLLAQLRATFSNARESLEQRLAKMRRVELLVMDDVAAVNATSWAKEQLFLLVDYRYRELLPCVFTADRAPAQVADILGVRLVERMLEMSREWQAEIGGANLRFESGLCNN